MSEMCLHNAEGNQLYLVEERAAFLTAARRQPARDRTLCEALHWTGCRPSEPLEITPARDDLAGGTIAIRSLKKRRNLSGPQKVVFRSVPVPAEFLDTLTTAHGIREAQKSRRKAGIPDAPLRSPKGLRKGFRVNATENGVPLHMVQKWMAYAQLSTTAIYPDAVGKGEQHIASRMLG